jgi:dTDP-4-dehydrorhamnose 3,5-epimerase-like enzyme
MSIKNLSTLDAIKITSLFQNIALNGKLTVIEGLKDVPFKIVRVFFVCGGVGALRGMHAHRECSQFLICLNGNIRVTCSDGIKSKDIELVNSSQGLLIPPGIWCSQNYVEENSILAVLCDKAYNECDYIRDFNQFIFYRANFA